MGIKTPKREKVVNNFEKYYNSREEVISFCRDYAKIMLDSGYKAKQGGTKQEEREQRPGGLKILTPKKIL